MTTMIHSIDTLSAVPDGRSPLEVLRRLSAARDEYEERLGWPVSIDVRHSRLAMVSGQVAEAVTMPAELGRLVLADLRIAMLAGPVFAGPDGLRWTFITEPAGHVHDDLTDELAALDVEWVAPGSYLVVPTVLSESPWIVAPATRPLPPWPAVVATARRTGHRQDRWDSVPGPKTA